MFVPHLFFLALVKTGITLPSIPADAPSLDDFIRKLRDENALMSRFCYVLFHPHTPITNAVHLSSDF